MPRPKKDLGRTDQSNRISMGGSQKWQSHFALSPINGKRIPWPFGEILTLFSSRYMRIIHKWAPDLSSVMGLWPDTIRRETSSYSAPSLLSLLLALGTFSRLPTKKEHPMAWVEFWSALATGSSSNTHTANPFHLVRGSQRSIKSEAVLCWSALSARGFQKLPANREDSEKCAREASVESYSWVCNPNQSQEWRILAKA